MEPGRRTAFQLLLWLHLLVLPTGLFAQVTELWRTGLTNSAVILYRLRTAAIDHTGNTIIGTASTLRETVSAVASIAKFDPQGNKLWEVHLGTNVFEGIDALDIAPDGSIFATLHPDPYTPGTPLLLVKVSSAGQELWRLMVENAGVQVQDSRVSALKADSSGNAVVSTIRIRELDSQTRIAEQLVAKFDPEGQNLWRTILPGYSYLRAQDFGSKQLALSDRGRISIGGTFSGEPLTPQPTNARGFVATLDADGQLEWWSANVNSGQFYVSVLANAKGNVAAAAPGEGATFFSKQGRAMHADPEGDLVLQLTPKGGFLLACRGYLCAVNSTGSREEWRFTYQLSGFWGVVPDGKQNWVVAGGARAGTSGLGLIGFDGQGLELWRAEFPDYGFQNDFRLISRNVLLSNGDGTVRVVAPLAGSLTGIGVAAFGIP